jgi:hypothetical protein
MNDAVQTAADMSAKVNAALCALRISNVNSDGSQVAHDPAFFMVPTPEHSQDAAREFLTRCPAK